MCGRLAGGDGLGHAGQHVLEVRFQVKGLGRGRGWLWDRRPLDSSLLGVLKEAVRRVAAQLEVIEVVAPTIDNINPFIEVMRCRLNVERELSNPAVQVQRAAWSPALTPRLEISLSSPRVNAQVVTSRKPLQRPEKALPFASMPTTTTVIPAIISVE